MSPKSLIILSGSRIETEKIAKIFAREITKSAARLGPTMIALQGSLGSGKTTFTQGFARALGIKENILSPTFVLMKVYSISQKSKDKGRKLKHLVHIDCYRIKSSREFARLGFKNLLKDEDAIILIEWADRIRKLVPKDAVWIKFGHGANFHQRIIEFKTQNGLLRRSRFGCEGWTKRKITMPNSKYF